MFGSLKNILNKEWYENKDNKYLFFATPLNMYYYEVFSVYEYEAEKYYMNTEFNNDEEYELFLNEIKSRSLYDYEVELTKDDKIITLSSCTNDGKKRIVLHAKLIND